MKTKYEILQIDAWNYGSWFWYDTFYIGEFKTASQNVNQSFMEALKKLGIAFPKGPVYIAHEYDRYELRNRKNR